MISRTSSYLRSNSVNIGIVIITLAFMGILFFQAAATSKLQEQVEQQDEIIRQIKDVTLRVENSAIERTNQINNLNRHIDCIVIFFSQPDRSQKAIENIDICTLKNVESGELTRPSTPTPRPQSVIPAPQTIVQNIQPAPSVQPTPQPSQNPVEALLAPVGNFINAVLGR